MDKALTQQRRVPLALPRSTAWPSAKALPIALGMAILLAFAIRVWGIEFGLPYRYHIDETFYVARTLELVPNGFDLPVNTHGPNLFFFLLLLEYGIYFLWTAATGMAASPSAFEALYRADPSTFVLLARLTSVLAGSLTLLPTYLLGKQLFGKFTGLIAAVFLAFAFQHIRESHYGTPDVFVGLLTTTCLVFATIEKGTNRPYYLAAFVGGLATGTKFAAVLLWVPLVLAQVMPLWSRRNGKKNQPLLRERLAGRLLWAGASFLLGFTIAYPNFVIRPAKFVEYVRFLAGVSQNGFVSQFQIEPGPAWYYYPFSLSWGLGWLLLLVVLFGIVLALTRRKRGDVLLISFVAVYFLFLARSPYYASRYLVPLLPLLCILGAAGLDWLLHFTREQWPRCSLVGVGMLIVLSLAQPLASALRHNYLLTQTDTRTLAKEWIEASIPEGTKVAIDWRKHAPPLRPMSEPLPAADPAYDVVYVEGIGLPHYPLARYQSEGVQYLIMSSFIDNLPLASASDTRLKNVFHQELETIRLVFEVNPYESEPPPFIFDQMFGPVTSLWEFERPGPAIRVYQIPSATTP